MDLLKLGSSWPTSLSRLAAQVPPPRFHMLTYHGVLASAASRRDEIVPGPKDSEE